METGGQAGPVLGSAGAPSLHEKAAIRVRSQRPKRVTVIGWFWIVAGVVKAITLAHYLRSLRGQLLDAHDTALALRFAPPWFAQSVSFVVGHLDAFGVFWVALGAFMVLAGASLLRGRPWARLGLELVCWFGLLEAPLVAAFLYFTGYALSMHDLPAAGRLEAHVFRGILTCAAWVTGSM